MKKGFTLVEIMIVVAIIGIIIAIAVPAFLRAREQSRSRACQENLSKIQGAKEQWALSEKEGFDAAPVEADLVLADGTGYLRSWPVCPATTEEYVPGTMGENPTCVYVAPNYAKQHNITDTELDGV